MTAPFPSPRGPFARPLVLLLLGLGVAMRAVVLPLPGTPDVHDWKATSFVASTDLVGVYGHGGSPPEERRLIWQRVSVTTEYPPLSQVEMALVGQTYRHIDPTFSDSRLLTILIKTPGLLAELAFVIAILTWGRRLIGDAAATWAALAFWLNPAVWLGGSVLGYLDAQMAVPATFALLAAAARRPVLAGGLAAVAVLTKPQALFVLPVMAFAIVAPLGPARWRDGVKALAAHAGILALAIAPFVVAGNGSSFLRAIRRLGEHNVVSGTAANLWWIGAWFAGGAARLKAIGWMAALTRPAQMVRISTVMDLGMPNPRTVGTALTIVALGWAAWRARRGLTRPAALVLAAWSGRAYFMLSAQVHENHSYLALPLLNMAGAEVPRLRAMYWLVSAAFTSNLYLFCGLGVSIPSLISRQSTGIDMSILLAVVFVLAVLQLTRQAAALTSSASAPRTT